MRSASSSGTASATCRVLGDVAGCSPAPGEVDVPVGNGVGEPAQAVDLDLDDVARAHRAGMRRRSREQDIARLERDQAADIGELVGHAPDEVGRAALLDDLAVEKRAQLEVGRIELIGRDELGAERAESVLPLDPQHRAAVGVAEVVQSDVVGDRVAGHVVEHPVDPDPVHRLADHHGQLALVVEKARAARAADDPAMAVETGRRLEEVGGLGRDARGVLLDPAVRGQVHGEDLARGRGREIARVGLGHGAPVVEHDHVPVAMTPGGRAAGVDPDLPLTHRAHRL